MSGFWAELKRRRVYRAGAWYAGVAFIAWQAAEIAVPALGLPEWLLTAIVGGSLAGFPVALLLAWLFDVRWDQAGVGLPQPAARALSAPGARRTAAIGAAVAGLAAIALLSWVTRRAPAGGDPGVKRVAVFPFSTVSLDDAELGVGIAELVFVGLAGIPGLSVVDPSAVWPPVAMAGLIPSPRTMANEYLDRSRDFSVERYVTGTAVLAGSSVDVSVRVHDGASGEELAALRNTASADSLSVLVDRIIIDLVAVLWEGDEVPEVRKIERLSTSNAQALTNFLEAMRHLRAGDPVSAEAAVELAVAEDSTFALAHLAHFRIRSWVLRLNGEPMSGIRPIVERADRHKERLSPRGRLVVAAALALDHTAGPQAIASLEQILEIDPTDVQARTLLSYGMVRDAWQVGRGHSDAVAAADAALALDSMNVPLLDLRFGLALSEGDRETAHLLAERMSRVNPQSPLSVAAREAEAMAYAPEQELGAVLSRLVEGNVSIAIAVLRRVRAVDPQRAETLTRHLFEEGGSLRLEVLGFAGLMQIWLARGRLTSADSLLAAHPTDPYVRQTILRRYIVASLAGVGRPDLAASAADELSRHAPADSIVAYMNSRAEVWAAGWAVGAWHAAFGDTAVARGYAEGLAANPPGGIPEQWPTALASDLRARLAQRGGDPAGAMALAQQAFTYWSIHDPYVGEWHPEASIRFHYAEMLEATGESDRAANVYQSFVDDTWVGFLTPVAAFRRAGLLDEAGRRQEAQRMVEVALEFWRTGEEAVVGGLRSEAERRLTALRDR